VYYCKSEDWFAELGPLIKAECWEPLYEALKTFSLVVIDDFHINLNNKDVQVFYRELFLSLEGVNTQLVIASSYSLQEFKNIDLSLKRYLKASINLNVNEPTRKDRDLFGRSKFVDSNSFKYPKFVKGGELINKML